MNAFLRFIGESTMLKLRSLLAAGAFALGLGSCDNTPLYNLKLEQKPFAEGYFPYVTSEPHDLARLAPKRVLRPMPHLTIYTFFNRPETEENKVVIWNSTSHLNLAPGFNVEMGQGDTLYLFDAAGFFERDYRHPDSMDTPIRPRLHPEIKGGVTVYYHIDPANELNETNETDNLVAVNLSVKDLEHLAEELYRRNYATWERNKRAFEADKKVQELRDLGYEVEVRKLQEGFLR